MWWYFLGTDGGPVVKVFRGSLRGNGGSSNVEAGLDWTVLCLEEGPQAETHMWDTGSCGDTSGCSFPTLSPNGAPSVLGGLQYSPLPSPSQQEERACLTHFSIA